MSRLPVYLDYCATTPCDPRVVEAMLPFFSVNFGNAASRQHSFGWQAEEAVKKAREQVAALVGSEPGEITFTSGATEAINLALKGAFETYATGSGRPLNHIITCSTEHNAVLDTCRQLEKRGAEVTYLGVDENGLPDLAALEASITPATLLIAIMYANNETGTIMPVREIGAIAKKKAVFFFTDATQAMGKIPVNVLNDGIDLLAFSGHKLYGPKGVGALYIRRRDPRVKIKAQIDGGGHEKGLRSGTLNVPGIVGFGKACEICGQEMEKESAMLRRLRDKLEGEILLIRETQVNGHSGQRLPHVANISFHHTESEGLVTAITRNIAVSSGSACSTASHEPSHVLKALGLSDELARSSLRFSLGRFTTEQEIDYTIAEVTQTLQKLREQSPYWQMYLSGSGLAAPGR